MKTILIVIRGGASTQYFEQRHEHVHIKYNKLVTKKKKKKAHILEKKKL